MNALTRHVPLLGQLARYDAGTFQSDAVAGLTTAIMLIPQAMAYAMLAGLDPIIGLYASTIPLAIYGLMGTSRQLAVGPVAMVSLLVASGVGAIVGGNDPVRYASLAALLMLMVGALQWGMSLARLGFLVKFLSHPVIAGFTSAAALIIGFSQLKHVMGVNLPSSHHVHEILLHAIEKAGDTNLVTLGISLASMATLVALKRFAPRFPRFLLVVAGGALAVWGLGLHEMGVSIVGDVPSGLPSPALPALELGSIQALLPTAITIALVGFMESISVAKAFARENKYEVDADQELEALGVANVVGAFFQGYPVTGGFSRTAVNAQAGALTGVASLVTAGAITVTLLFLTPLFYFLPKAVLASIIMTAVFGLIATDEVKHLWKVSRPDLAAMGLTFVATLTLGIEQGILVGVAASLLWFIWSTSRPHLAVLGELPGTTVYRNVERYPEARTTPGVVAIRVDAPLYFANTAFLKTAVQDAIGEDARHLVVDCKAIGSVDAQALSTIGEILDAMEDRSITVWLAGVRGPVRDALEAAHLMERIGWDHVVERVHEAVDRASGRRLELLGGAK
ncbi:MAG: solute carrier family 26 protein [Alphaproteobacteria bacterium]|nr:solute carrier family 26 protein [Alphaproteobacteria bacterium]